MTGMDWAMLSLMVYCAVSSVVICALATWRTERLTLRQLRRRFVQTLVFALVGSVAGVTGVVYFAVQAF